MVIPWGLEGKRFSLEKRMLSEIGLGFWVALFSASSSSNTPAILPACCGADVHGWLWMEPHPVEEQSDSGICAVSPAGGFCFEVPLWLLGKAV